MEEMFSCKKKDSGKSKCGRSRNDNPSPYCQEFSKPPWTKPQDERSSLSPPENFQFEQTRNSDVNKAFEEQEFGKQYLAKQKAAKENDECSNMPNPCCPEPCVPQPKPKFKKRPIKPFATTDQLRDKIFGYIENQPNPMPLRPFRGYRDDIVRQQLCCSEDLVTNPPDPCPEDPCEKWNEILRTCNTKEKEAVMCEVNRLRDKMPCGLTEEEQLNALPCMGASQNAMCAFKEQIEAEKNACTCPPPSPPPSPPQRCGVSPCQSPKPNPCQSPKPNPCQSPKPNPCQSPKPNPCQSPKPNPCQSPKPNPCQSPKPNPCQSPKPTPCQSPKPSPCQSPKPNPCQSPKPNPCQSQNSNPCSNGKAANKCQKKPKCASRVERLSVGGNKENDCQRAKSVNSNQNDELSEIIEYCKQVKEEVAAMEVDDGNGAQEEDYDAAEPDISAFNADTTNDNSDGQYEPDPELRCEEEISDEDPDEYHDHPMFGGPDSKPKRTMKEEMKMYREHVANIRKRYFGEFMKGLEDTDTITPDIAAAMVYSEELGLKIKSAPQTAYDYLYPEAPSQPTLNIGQVTESAPKGIDDIVVPLAPPMMLTATEFPGLEDPAMLDHPRILQVMPSMNLIEEPKATDTMPANDIVELVTGTTHVNLIPLLFPEYEGMEPVDEADEDDEDARFNIKLPSSIPAHFSQIQIRGSEPPTWFPGYYVALPSKAEVSIERKYGHILEKAWEEVQPEFVRPGGGAAIIGS